MEPTKPGSSAEFAATVLRLGLAVMYLSHAWFKLGVLGMPVTEQYFVSVGFPAWSAWLTVAAEAVGGLALAAGWRTRWVALALLPILLGALQVHWPNGWVFSSQGGGWEFPAYLMVMSVVQALLGNGAWTMAPRNSTAALRPAARGSA